MNTQEFNRMVENEKRSIQNVKDIKLVAVFLAILLVIVISLTMWLSHSLQDCEHVLFEKLTGQEVPKELK